MTSNQEPDRPDRTPVEQSRRLGVTAPLTGSARSLRVCCFQHVPYEGPGCILPWFEQAGAVWRTVHCGAGGAWPKPEEVDFLVLMGGPMSVRDTQRFPWLSDELRFLHRYLETGRPALGICLGAQLIATALGASVHRAAAREIGWFPVSAVKPLPPASFALPPVFCAFHWHSETFELPAGAVWLARSDVCPNQAFQWGSNVLALQFHLEVTPEDLRRMVAHGRHELTPAEWVQDEKTILRAGPSEFRETHALMGRILRWLTGARNRRGQCEERA